MAQINELAPNTLGVNNQGRYGNIPSELLPPIITGPIFDQAQEHSLVMKLGRNIPVQYGQTNIPVTLKRPEVGQVGTGTSNAEREGGLKPLTGVAWGYKTLSPIKLATIVTVSEEFATKNPLGLYTELQADLAYAIGRGIDLAVFHGLSPLTGTALQGIDSTNVVANSPNLVALAPYNPTDGTGGYYQGLLDGYDLVNESPKFNFDGWAVDPRFRSQLLREQVPVSSGIPGVVGPALADTSLRGQGILDLSTTTATIMGLPAHFGRAVRGDLGAAPDSGLVAVGGDFQQLAYGFADQIRVKMTNEASITDGSNTYSMWQTNQVAILVEVTFGWILGDVNGFVGFTKPRTTHLSLGTGTGGTFKLAAGGERIDGTKRTTAAITNTSSAGTWSHPTKTELQTALVNAGVADAVVTGTATDGTFTITSGDAFSVADDSTTGGSAGHNVSLS